MDRYQNQFERFLDDGWSVISRLNYWLSSCQSDSSNHAQLVDTIRGLQSLWSAAEDLQFKRIAYSCVTVEQLLERFCAGSLEFTAERARDVTAGVAVLQDLLLGVEATRDEPTTINLDVLAQLHRHAIEPRTTIRPIDVPQKKTAQQPLLAPSAETEVKQIRSAAVQIAAEYPREAKPADPSPDQAIAAVLDQITIESTVLAMLEQFVMKLDETCHRLHQRMIADQTPYVSTTTRLEHLVQVTRDLVSQLSRQNRSRPKTSDDDSVTNADQAVQITETSKVPSQLSAKTIAALDQRLAALQHPTPNSPVIDPVESPLGRRQDLGLTELPRLSGRVLIIEESLFYRQMITAAVHATGLHTKIVELAEAVREIQVPALEFQGILISTAISGELVELLTKLRQERGVKVVGLLSSTTDASRANCFDELVSRSNPRQLRETLIRLMGGLSSDARKIA